MSLAPISQLSTYGPDSAATLEPEQARGWCRRLAREHYENFPVLSALVPADRRDDFAAVYAFCRWADDLADEIGDSGRSLELLDWWRRELHQCFDGSPHHPVFMALAPTIDRFGLERAPFDDLITAFEQDQRVARYETWDDVLGYCRLSANPVGRIVLRLLEERRDADDVARSDDLCTALQLTNHWQDVQRDLIERDRIYIPQDLITIEDFEGRLRASAAQGYAVDRTFLPATRELIRGLVERTWPFFERGSALVDAAGPTARPILWLFAAGGQRVLRSIEAWNYETVLHRPTLGRGTKLALIARAWLSRAWSGSRVSRQGSSG